ncbi:exo-beta-N-acetylmuramidase NamZ family protein [Vallitalea okinawensis]|uniref:exo-beta-N-acetylmuramidase NamZ family protein n=1 Tax=Vallitalea okinawensis TaxID=2078660 RepID=UPI000CFDF7E0|nr:DUF1343 domain-containing protein [Vallitalea okinawensis]
MILKGIDRIREYDHLFKNKRLGLITSISGVNNELLSTIEILHENYRLNALFAPEHGVRGDRGAGQFVDTYIDDATGVTVYSLYRKDSKRLTEGMLNEVDAVVYDIQDLGVRYYTFISTLIYALEDCATHGKEVIILDRPNPLGGVKLEGNVLKNQFKSFVGTYPLATRYGLTVGELANMVNEEQNIGCHLTVIPCREWRREMLFHETDQTWVMPSLGIPRFETALLYVGTCLLEGTNVSEGRGTSCPFEILGAPYINAEKLVKHLREKNLNGVGFTPVYFTPTSSKHKGVFCQGVHIHMTDYKEFEGYKTGLVIIESLKKMYPDSFALLPPFKENSKPFISLLSGNDYFEKNDWTSEDILEKNDKDLIAFRKRKEKYHLYE